MRELTSPLRIKRKMKPPVPTRPKDLPESRESRPEERKGEASSSSYAIRMVLTKSTMSEITLSMLIQNRGLAIVMENNTYASIADILQRDLRIEPSEATIWSRLDEFGQITTRLMIQGPLFGNWFMITPEFGSQNIIIQYFDPMVNPPLPALLTLEPHIPSIDRSDEELHFEEIRLTWSTTHLTINPFCA